MQVTQESTGDLTATIKVELEPADYQAKIITQLKEYQQKANMPGFRPGKVPISVIKKMYGKSVAFDIVNKQFSDSLFHYLVENKIDIMASPLPNKEKNEPIDLDVESNYAFYFDIALAPAITLDLNKIESIPFYQITTNEEMLQKSIMDIRKRYGSFNEMDEVDGNAMIFGQFTEIDTTGNPIENGIKNDAYLYADKIENEAEKNKLLGSKVDAIIMLDIDKVAKNEYEKAYMLGVKKEDLVNINSSFSYQIKKITGNQPTDLNEELYLKVYPNADIKDFESFQEKVKTEISATYQKESERKFVNDAIAKIQETHDFELPEAFLKRFMVETDESGKLNTENIEEEFEKQKKAIKWQLLENKLVTDFNLSVTNDDVKEFIKGYFRQSQDIHEHDHDHDHEHEHSHSHDHSRLDQIAETIMKNEQEVNRIKDKMFEDQLTDFFKNHIPKKEESIDFDNFVKILSQQN